MTSPFPGYDPAPAADADDVFQSFIGDEETDTVEEADESHDSASGDKKSSRRKSSRPARITAGQVKKVLQQATFIESQPEDVRELAAAVLGVADTTEDLVVATLNAPKAAGDVIDDIVDIAETPAEGFAPVLKAAALLADREAARRTWSILVALGVVKGTLPTKDVLAATKVAEAAGKLTVAGIDSLRQVTELFD